jgi:hypothetical protein
MASEEEAAADRRKTLPPVEVLFLPDGLHYDYAEMPQKKYRRTRVTSPQDSSRSATTPPTTLVNRCQKDGDRGVVQPVPCAQYETQTFTECHVMPYEEVQDPDLLVYCNLVKQYSACVPVNSSMVEFVVKDFDMVKKELVDKYLCIQRRMLFLESKSLHFWVYACSCTPQSLPLLNAVARNIGSPESEQDVISELEHNCLHTAALKNILFSVNCQDQLSPGPEDEGNTLCSDTNDYLFEVDATMPVVGVHADGTSAVIGLDRSRLKCLTCPSVKTCSHAIYLSLLLNEDGESHVTCEVQGLHNLILARASGCDKPVTGTVQSTAALVSNKPIGVLPHKEAKVMLPRSLEDSMIHLKPPGTVCPSCNTDMTPIADGVFPLFCFQSIEAAKVHRLTCVNCNKSISYEGNEDGILYLRHHLITHSLLRDYMYHFVHGRSSMYRYYRVWCSRQAEIEDPMAIDFQQKMSYGHFRAAWYSFMSLLDIQYEEGFQCPHCGPAPSVVVGDATTLAYRQCYDSWTKAVSCTEDKTEYVSQPIVHGR